MVQYQPIEILENAVTSFAEKPVAKRKMKQRDKTLRKDKS